MEKNYRAILLAPVRALTVELGRVGGLPEHLQQLFVGDFGRIVIHLDRLGVSGGVGAYLFVCGIRRLSARVTHASSGNAGNLAEGGLNAPKTACRKSCFRHVCWFSRRIVQLRI